MPVEFSIPPASSFSASHLNEYIKKVGLPPGSLGLLESVVEKLAVVQNSYNIEMRQLHHLVFCSDHGVYQTSHQSNPSHYSTTDHVLRLLNGQSPLAKLCEQHQVELCVVDCGLKGPELNPFPKLFKSRVAQGTRDFSIVPAMTAEELEKAISVGTTHASMNLAEGANVLSFGALGLGNTTSAAAITMSLLSLPAEQAVINQNHSDHVLVRDKVDALTQAMALHQEELTDAWSVVRLVGGFEIAAIMGAMAITAELGGLFLVDGFACSAALLALSKIYPNITDYAQFTNQSSHAAQHAIMNYLGQRPLLNLNLGIGEGTGSVLAWPLIVAAVSWLRS